MSFRRVESILQSALTIIDLNFRAWEYIYFSKEEKEKKKTTKAEMPRPRLFIHVFHDYLIDLATKTSWTSKTKGSLVQRYIYSCEIRDWDVAIR